MITYAQQIRAAAGKQGITTIRQLARACGYSYEQVRKVWVGDCSMSRKLSDRLCKLLGLDTERMWNIAIDEKFQRKHRRPVPARDVHEATLLTVWSRVPRNRRALAIDVLRTIAETLDAHGDRNN